MEIPDISQLVRNTGRFREVVLIMAKYGLAEWLDATNASWVRALLKESQFVDLEHLSREARIREATTELGTTFIKLGQMLSTRPDLIGPELADELVKLQSGTPPDSPEQVRVTVEEELGKPVEELFENFDEQALASASIGQVHVAQLSDGTDVVVKVQHPGIEDRIRNDLEIIARLSELAEKYSPALRQYRPVETAAEFSQTLMRELDFRTEQRNLERFRRNFRDDSTARFPAPYSEFSTQRVLTMDRLQGISLSRREKLTAAEMDMEALARQGAEIFVKMIFRDAFYHADPHPGNLMATNPEPSADGRTQSGDAVIGILDCGMVGRLDEPLREDIERAIIAVVKGDSTTVVDVIMRRGSTPDDLDPDQLRLDVEDFLDIYVNQSLDEFDLSGCLNGIVTIIRRHGIVLPARVGMLLKVLVMLEGTAKQLSPRFSLAELIQPYAEKSFRDKFSPKRLLKRMESRYQDWDRLLEILPRDVSDILHRLKKGSFDVHLNHRRLETTINRLVLCILAAALFLGSSLMLSQNVRPLLWDVSVPGAVGSAAAVWLGYRVIRAIKRMGDIQQK